MRPQPLIAVADVEAASRWYQEVLGCRRGHGGAEYERLLAGEELILQLHDWDTGHHHGGIGDPAARNRMGAPSPPVGGGLGVYRAGSVAGGVGAALTSVFSA